MGLFDFIDNLTTYWASDIKNQTGKGFMDTFSDTGNYGELLCYKALFMTPGKKDFLHNCYVPTAKGFSEIDLLMIHNTGLYVVESKNYSGWIFGDENQKQWTQCLAGGKKSKFYNPVWQNKGHMEALKAFFSDYDDLPIFSLIVFSERCELKNVTFTAPNTFVIKRDHLNSVFRKQIHDLGDYDVDKRIDVYRRLLPFCKKSDVEKQEHIDRILQMKMLKVAAEKPVQAKQELNSPIPELDKRSYEANHESGIQLREEKLPLAVRRPETPQAGLCPRCGKQLIQRKGKTGPFIGCSGYPNCRFTSNVEFVPAEQDDLPVISEMGTFTQEEAVTATLALPLESVSMELNEVSNLIVIPSDMTLQTYSQSSDERQQLGICPRCGKQLVQRKGKNGPFIGCGGYPSCRFTSN